RDFHVTGVQTCALPISPSERHLWRDIDRMMNPDAKGERYESSLRDGGKKKSGGGKFGKKPFGRKPFEKKSFEKKFEGERGGFKEIGRASCRERGEVEEG